MTLKLVAQHSGTKLPVPVEMIAIASGCAVRRSDLKDISGILVRSPTGNVIGVNSKHGDNRQRFTIAHELGHLLLHEGQEVTYDKEFRVSLRSGESAAGTNIEEVEANFFAASLLMPDNLLLADVRTRTLEIENAQATEELAEAFGVSVQAMTLRLARLIGRQGRSALSGSQARLFF